MEKDLKILEMYRRFGGKREFKRSRDCSDEGARLLCLTHGLNEKLGRHSDRDGRVECILCGERVSFTCCGSVLLM